MLPDRPVDFGGRLRTAREGRAITLNQIAVATKISRRSLEALERNDISRLPGGLFTRAFVRSYASQVGLDPEQTVRDFMASFPDEPVAAGHPRSYRVEDVDALESDRQTAATFLRLVALSIPLAALVVYFGASGRFAPDRPTRAPAAAPVATTPEPSVSPAQPSASPAEPSVTPVKVSAQATSPASAGTTDARTNAAGKTAAVRANETPAPMVIVLTASAPCWLSATADGRRLFERLLPAGETQSVQVARELGLTAGDAAALRMTINGDAVRTLGRPGQVVTVRVTPDNYRSFLAPR
jgi:cytoskeletal protein RodZ